jgi:branched-chain amino acid transport system ATP-binding protein
MALLEIQNLTKKFGGLIANQDIELNIHENEVVGLIGPNGAGKTTLFNCISGIHKPEKGKIIFSGEEITVFRPDVICQRGIARTFQLVRTYKGLTVLENTMIGAFRLGGNVQKARKVALEMLDFIGLKDKRDTLANGLTLADKKRLAIAIALATKPKMLLLDEAMAGLTPKEMQTSVDLIRRIHELGTGILMVEHVMEVIMPISHRVIVLNHGVKIAEDTPEKIVKDEKVIKAYLGEKYYARHT